MKITDEAVEAAAKAMFARINRDCPWDGANMYWQDSYRGSAVAAIEAALPHLADNG